MHLSSRLACANMKTLQMGFSVDRHPEMDNVWLVGGGSGHGFKHGPALGEYVAGRVLGDRTVTPEPRFLLASKNSVQNRQIY